MSCYFIVKCLPHVWFGLIFLHSLFHRLLFFVANFLSLCFRRTQRNSSKTNWFWGSWPLSWSSNSSKSRYSGCCHWLLVSRLPRKCCWNSFCSSSRLYRISSNCARTITKIIMIQNIIITITRSITCTRFVYVLLYRESWKVIIVVVFIYVNHLEQKIQFRFVSCFFVCVCCCCEHDEVHCSHNLMNKAVMSSTITS